MSCLFSGILLGEVYLKQRFLLSCWVFHYEVKFVRNEPLLWIEV